MGSENLFHKRKARTQKETQRRKAFRKSYDRVLIVCEGEKTEPFYFEEMRVILKLNSANIEIDGRCDEAPSSIFNYAQKLFKIEQKKGEGYDRIFCVFDRDQHETFDETLKNIEKQNIKLKNEIFTAIYSNPAFEYWFLLHFNPTTKPYAPLKKKSIGDQVETDLKKYLPNYQKKQKNVYSCLIEQLESAKAHSTRIFNQALKSGNMNPSTNVHQLVEYLENIKNN